jgi:hypothetical protein
VRSSVILDSTVIALYYKTTVQGRIRLFSLFVPFVFIVAAAIERRRRRRRPHRRRPLPSLSLFG